MLCYDVWSIMNECWPFHPDKPVRFRPFRFVFQKTQTDSLWITKCLSFIPLLPVHWCLLFPFVARPMPSFGSCDTASGDLKRYIVKHQPVTHAAAQTPTLTRLTCCQCSSTTYILPCYVRREQGDSIMTSCKLTGMFTPCVTLCAHTLTEAHAHTHTHTPILRVHEIGAQTLWPRLQLSLFTAFTIVD